MGDAIQMSLSAQDQVQALPAPPLLSFAEAITVLEIAPWRGRPFNRRNPDGAVTALDRPGLPDLTWARDRPAPARMRDLPAVVRVVCCAVTAGRRPRRMHAAWALSSAWLQVPATTAAVWGRRAVVSADRTAVVVVTTAHADVGLLVAVGAAWIAVTAVAMSWAADLTIAVVEPLAGFVGACVTLGLLPWPREARVHCRVTNRSPPIPGRPQGCNHLA
ncbi:MAG TPA: hypothetical protein VHN80_27715 [Kineosporiaceae bacterium]|nr:hypothetical protein [Kineosporiaceae bacterium]